VYGRKEKKKNKNSGRLSALVYTRLIKRLHRGHSRDEDVAATWELLLFPSRELWHTLSRQSQANRPTPDAKGKAIRVCAAAAAHWKSQQQNSFLLLLSISADDVSQVLSRHPSSRLFANIYQLFFFVFFLFCHLKGSNLKKSLGVSFVFWRVVFIDKGQQVQLVEFNKSVECFSFFFPSEIPLTTYHLYYVCA
jgi:hypothetical protein